MIFKENDNVTWTSQAHGSEKTKTGTIIAVVPPRCEVRDRIAALESGRYRIPKDIAFVREAESYLVAVAGKTSGAKPTIYWPLAHKLRYADQEDAIDSIVRTIAKELSDMGYRIENPIIRKIVARSIRLHATRCAKERHPHRLDPSANDQETIINKTYSATLTIDVDTSLENYEAENGNQAGWRTANGRILRPAIVFELEGPDGSHRDLADDELQKLGLSYDYADSTKIEQTQHV